MRTGYLYQKNEKEIKTDVEKGLDVVEGVDLISIMDTINLHEINHPGKPENVLSLLKQEIMLIQGKIDIQDEGKN